MPEVRSVERDGMLVTGVSRKRVGDVVRRPTNQSLVHEETQFVLDSLHIFSCVNSFMCLWFVCVSQLSGHVIVRQTSVNIAVSASRPSAVTSATVI